jgi:dGTPase
MARPSVTEFDTPDGLAPYATKAFDLRGRLYPEPESRTRTPLQRDRDRIIHCGAFRRLKHKTQVFVYHEGDYYRTRLTHSLEVAQIARSISRVLGLDEDLAEALALAHDLGHTCFGHAGEDALAACMKPYGGFDHNAHAIRLMTKLETRYAAFDGLNLNWETLEGIAKHNGPLTPRLENDPLPEAIVEYNAVHDLELGTFAGLEAQVAALSDDIAYNNHDIDDGLRAGLFTVEDLLVLPLVGDVFRGVEERWTRADRSRQTHEAVRELIGLMIEDLIGETARRAKAAGVASVADVRAYGKPIAAFTADMDRAMRTLKDFLFQNMYRHWKVMRMTGKAHRVVRDLFDAFIDEPRLMPDEWRAAADGPRTLRSGRVVSDYIAGMTDRFAFIEHKRLFGLDADPL